MTFAVYVHWPFCISKCPYCDFNSHVGDAKDQQKWRSAYRQELAFYATLLPERTVTSVFFGGGTPSLMQAATVASVLDDIARLWPLASNAEITLEANPSSAEAALFADFRAAGVNRLSLGVQSFNDDALRFLGRAHDAAEARAAIDLAAHLFPRFSFDLIYARQNQTPQMWQDELTEALKCATEHLSLYQLTIEPHTVFATRTRRGETLSAPDDQAIAMYEMTQEIMDAAGLSAYEISNHARPGEESRHNMAYWHYDDYLGIGPGAHGRHKRDGNRHAIENFRSPQTWLAQVAAQGHGIKQEETLDTVIAMQEAIMMGLRLTQGIDLSAWQKKFGTRLTDQIAPERLQKLSDERLIVFNAKELRATRAGLQRLNAVLSYLL